MFSNTAYEALYQYIGLSLHGKFIEVITSQKIFLAALMLIFGSVFFLTTIHFFARYLPRSVVRQRSVPLSNYFKIVFALFIGISLLKVESSTSVKRFDGQPWSANPYIQQKMGAIPPNMKVSFLFDILSRSAEEIVRLLSSTIDELFATTNSQLKAPDFFFKAILYSGTQTIEDPALVSSVDFYADQCFDKTVALTSELGVVDKFFSRTSSVDGALQSIVVTTSDGNQTTCLDIKNQVQSALVSYSSSKGSYLSSLWDQQFKPGQLSWGSVQNLAASQLLVNHFYETREGFLGTQKLAELPDGAANWFQKISRALSFDGLMNLFGDSSALGASLAAKRAQEFSDNLSRAPHVAGAVKMVLIFIFPWLVFAVVAGRWKVLAYWYVIYLSVLLWTPVWTLFYHIMVGIAQSAEQLQAFGKLTDGISLYSAELILHRMNYLYAAFSWIQIMIGVLLTGTVLFAIRPLLTDSASTEAPEFVGEAKSLASTGMSAAKVMSL